MTPFNARARNGAVAATMLLTLGWPIGSDAQDRSCTLDEVQGEAMIQSAQGNTRVESGYEVGGADTLTTGPGARVHIACSDGIMLTIGPDTEIQLASLVDQSAARNDVLLNLNRGVGRFLAPVKSWRRFTVSGPTAEASVDTADWIMTSDGEATSALALEGSVTVRAKGIGGAVLSPGSGIDVDGEGKVVKVAKWGAPRVAKVKTLLGLQ